jgi:two-component system, response regulator
MSKPTILLVEDNPDDVELTIMALKNHFGHVHVDVARDGAEAVAYFIDKKKILGGNWPPQVVLLDLNLPKLNGLEVLLHLRNNSDTARIPVIVLTTTDDETERFDCYNAGANSFIRKPIASEQFTEVIRQLGTYWLDINMPSPIYRVNSGS